MVWALSIVLFWQINFQNRLGRVVVYGWNVLCSLETTFIFFSVLHFLLASF